MKPTYRGLIIDSIWVDKILSGEKTWEIRGSRTHKRGKIALIKISTGKIYGTCDLIDSIGPLSREELEANIDKHCVQNVDDILERYETPYAWVVENAKKPYPPIPYIRKRGQIIWVNLQDHEKEMKSLQNSYQK